MKKIIKQGIDPKTKTFEVECIRCKTQFTYQMEDVESDQRDGDYVECPCCKSFINHAGNHNI